MKKFSFRLLLEIAVEYILLFLFFLYLILSYPFYWIKKKGYGILNDFKKKETNNLLIKYIQSLLK